MDNNEEKILSEIRDDMQAQSGLVINAVNGEIDALRENQLNFFREGLKKETDTYLEKELSDLRLYAATKASQDKLKAKKDLLSLRHTYAQKIEDEAERRLQEFTKEEDYRKYLETALDEVNVSADGYFITRPEDEQLMKSVLSERGLANQVKTRYFRIGGFLYVDEAKKMEYSCDLSERMREVTDWFHSHSGFSVAEGGEVK